jgi:serine/threonine protein kinase/Tfp pilus assembly protein PilF
MIPEASTTSAAPGAEDGVLADLLDRVADRVRAGEDADMDALTRAHPEHAATLRRLVPAVRWLAEVDRPDADAEPHASPGPLSGLTALGDFRILGELGRGGMGVVYAAEQVSLGRQVALKVLPLAATLDPRRLQRFQNEARAAGCLHHTNIVPVFAVGVAHGVHYYAMQLIEGQTLAAVVRDLRVHTTQPCAARPDADTASRHGDTPAIATALSTDGGVRSRPYINAITRLGMQAAEALDYAHQLGIVHRDIKPANFMMDNRGQLWVTDFGLAQFRDGEGCLTLTGDMVGTLRYMSPEQALGQRTVIDHRADVYALGATLYELLTLEPALDGRDRQELLRQIAFEDPKPSRRINPAIPADLETIVLKAMAKAPADRYATAQELADDLRRFLEDKAIRARRPSALDRSRKWARRHRSMMWSAALACAATLVILAASVGWTVRDKAARDAKVRNDLEQALFEAQRNQRDGKVWQAQAAARRAEALLSYCAADPAMARRVDHVVRVVAEEAAEKRLLADLEEIRRQQVEIHPTQHRFAIEKTLPAYRKAFREFGWEADTTTPAAAATRLAHRPRELQATVLAALDHWLILGRHMKGAETSWLEQVLGEADGDPWRRQVRAARKQSDLPALEQLAHQVKPADQSPEALFMLELSLRQRGAYAAALDLLRRAHAAFPGDFWINHNLGMALHTMHPPQLDDALRYLTAAVALRPDSAGARNNLALVLFKKGRCDEAAATFRQAIGLKADYAVAYSNLGLVLSGQGRCDEAIDAYRKATELQPEILCIHQSLGDALRRTGRLAEAEKAYRRLLDRNQDHAEGQCNLGVVLLQQGSFVPALAALERGHALGSARAGWSYPSARWVKECRRLIELDGRLPAILDGKVACANAAERVEVANLCYYRQRPAAAARFWSEALQANPKLADDITAGNRYAAARTAALAAAGKGIDGAALDGAQRAQWRKQALDWLQADLAAHAEQLQHGEVWEHHSVRQRLRHWQSYPDLAALREPAALEQLPPDEQAAFRQLWLDVTALLARADAVQAARGSRRLRESPTSCEPAACSFC